MNPTLERALINSLDCLVELAQEGTRPEAARLRLKALRAEHFDIEMELLWEEQPYDGSIHFDILLHPPGHGTVSLSFCPDRGLPWPLRGIHRSSDMDLMRVNKTILKVDQAIACLDFIWSDARATKRLVNACLVQEALDEEPVQLTEGELQSAMDRFRSARRLYRAADTFRWMQERGMTQNHLEQRVRDEAMVGKLRERVTAGVVESYFESHRADFDTAAVARIVSADEGTARQAYDKVRRGTTTFYGEAQFCFLKEIGHPPSREVFSVFRRREVPPEVASIVFTASPDELVGPLRSGDTYSIFHILSLSPARLDARTRNDIQSLLFDEWLKERREAAAIEWLWGNAAQTSQAAR